MANFNQTIPTFLNQEASLKSIMSDKNEFQYGTAYRRPGKSSQMDDSEDKESFVDKLLKEQTTPTNQTALSRRECGDLCPCCRLQ